MILKQQAISKKIIQVRYLYIGAIPTRQKEEWRDIYDNHLRFS